MSTYRSEVNALWSPLGMPSPIVNVATFFVKLKRQIVCNQLKYLWHFRVTRILSYHYIQAVALNFPTVATVAIKTKNYYFYFIYLSKIYY